MVVLAQNEAYFYTRDSGGKHETTPTQYVRWAIAEAQKYGVVFQSRPEDIEMMIQNGLSHYGNLFLDYDVPGHEFQRKGLDALLEALSRNKSVTHLFIPRRDRLSRPNNPADAVQLELKLRMSGVTLVFIDRVCPALPQGQAPDIGELIVGLVDYYKAGKDRRQLAQQMVSAQITLAQNGFSVGGRAPYGFDRWLVKADGTPVRRLMDKEYVKLPGHHTAWIPSEDGRLEIALRIRELLKTMRASRVAALLTEEGVPSPDAGRTRTDRGVVHKVSGVWHQTTVANIGRNSLFAAMTVVGRRSMGDQLRFTPQGPRPLKEDDFRADRKPKVIQNPMESQIVAPAHFEPPVERSEHEELTEILDARAGTQRGKPRSRDPNKNPLGGQIVDLNCAWPMYRVPYNGSFRYTCAAYMQSHGQDCSHNHVDGPTATRFVLSCMQQKLLMPRLMEKLRARLTELAHGEYAHRQSEAELRIKRASLKRLEADLATAKRNMAFAKNPEHHDAVAEVYDGLKADHAKLTAEIDSLERKTTSGNPQAEVQAALAAFDRLPDLVKDETNLAAIGEAIRLVNVRLFLGFHPVQVKKRILNKVSRGMVTFGSAPSPVQLYRGPTGRRGRYKDLTTGDAKERPPDRHVPGGEGNSLGNVSRGDRI